MTVPTMRFKDAVAADTRKIGIIGLDTSHSPAFAQFFNNPANEAQTRGFRVTAAYPYGSQLIESSRSRIAGYTEEIKRSGVRICPSIKSLLSQVDYVLLETNDGNLHLAQMREIVRAKKPVFIDKPVAATLQDVYSIYDLAREANLPVFSASSLRYMVKAQQAASGLYGKVLGADTFSPATLDQSHTDLYWYG
ncbi:MAG TPA: Gfo/Idh/MocA family oxidoreductase, partial [Flavihumibacter sp.]|nr:Gfo/Idh/MocA family oxidoreductase [Flavihumibacter sp.]